MKAWVKNMGVRITNRLEIIGKLSTDYRDQWGWMVLINNTNVSLTCDLGGAIFQLLNWVNSPVKRQLKPQLVVFFFVIFWARKPSRRAS